MDPFQSGGAMNYFSLARRVPEASAIEPKAMIRLYDLVAHTPLLRAAHRFFVSGALAQGVMHGRGLDLGTGPGYVAIEIARQRPGLRMAGLDLAAHMVEKARHKAGRTGLNGRGLWLQADGHRLPFADGSFDLVLSTFALHHWEDPVRILNEIARLLRPPAPDGRGAGGRYYIADVCREANPLQRLLAYASIPALSTLFGSYRGYGGYYESMRAGYTRDELRELVAQSSLPPGDVGLDSTWLIPILTIASKQPSHGTAGHPSGAPGAAQEGG